MVELALNIIIVILGVFSFVSLFKLNKSLGGKISNAVNWFMLGIIAVVAGFAWSFAFQFEEVIEGLTHPIGLHDMHHVLILFGMIFFIISSRRFTNLISGS